MPKSATTNRRQFLGAALGVAIAGPGCLSEAYSHRSPPPPGFSGLPASDQTTLARGEGAIEFESSDRKLVDGFHWAKAQALAYARTDGSIGPWYEAALPGRDAFCMRDVSHMSTGAQFLGLGSRTLNMLRRFAKNISASKKWCTWWEITRDNLPAPVDYNNDQDFWYDLPASFDVVDACYRQWIWTGDEAYLDEVFLNFYQHTVTDYVRAWDRDQNGLLEHLSSDGHMGIATYDEDLGHEVLVGADLVAAQYAAYRDYAAILRVRDQSSEAEKFDGKAAALKSLYNEHWWDAKDDRFFSALGEDGKFHGDLKEGNGRCTLELPLYYGLTAAGDKMVACLKMLEKCMEADEAAAGGAIGGVEGRSYMPDIFYLYGRSRDGYSALTAMMDPGLKRREYPEVSFTAIGSLCAGLMGIRVSQSGETIETFPQLTAETGWAALHRAPVRGNAISVQHKANGETTLTNEAGPELEWRAGFPVKSDTLLADGKRTPVQHAIREGGGVESYCTLRVKPGETRTVSARPG
jgi:hypothetical protein